MTDFLSLLHCQCSKQRRCDQEILKIVHFQEFCKIDKLTTLFKGSVEVHRWTLISFAKS